MYVIGKLVSNVTMNLFYLPKHNQLYSTAHVGMVTGVEIGDASVWTRPDNGQRKRKSRFDQCHAHFLQSKVSCPVKLTS